MEQRLNLFDMQRAILHVDGDCFFASCEIAQNPSLRGKCVITGMERGIVSSLTYEAKARGVKRGMSLRDVKKVCPEAVLMPSDYETYSLYSMRMFNIVKRYTSAVEEYSIDECFADLTGMRRPLNMSYEAMAKKIKQNLDDELGMTFSVGLAPSKVLAKIASKWEKPSGLTIIQGRKIHQYLDKLLIKDVWGIGRQTSAYLNKCGIQTALQFVKKDNDWVKKKLSKPFYEIWQELKGNAVYELLPGQKHNYKSISKTKTFTPPSNCKNFVYSQLSKNVENACIKARRHKLVAKKISFFLKTQDFEFNGAELKLNMATAVPSQLLKVIFEFFGRIFTSKKMYRSTGVILMDLAEDVNSQLDLFGETLRADKFNKIFMKADEISEKYGKHSLFLGSSLKAMTEPQHYGNRDARANRKKELFKGENIRKRINIPMLGKVL
ncbi:MAG: DNA polymerase IV [bacterium]